MLLKKLEAYGFKSFAEHIEIDFDRGITAIVGPNGSGKSNITDAIRWVMGEQNIHNLRAGKAEDIIFAGSSVRKSSGIAHVALTFDNEDGSLPLDFQEVTIVRRLFRTGESEFYINKARCRLKDIYALFADTGLGRDSISVISQNKVDEVLNAKPQDRRLLFEECAGITKYRDRKKEAIKKLDSAEQNFLRINDIISEINKQLEPLSLEAQRTMRYSTLKSKYDDYKLSEILGKYENYSAQAAKYNKNLQELQTKRTDKEAALKALEAKNSATEENIANFNQTAEAVKERNRKLTEEIDRSRNKCNILEERIKQNTHSLNLAKTSIDAQQKQKETTEIKLDETAKILAADKETELNTQKELAKLNTVLTAKEKQIAAEEQNLQQLQQDFAEKRRQREENRNKLNILQHDLKEKENQLKERQVSFHDLQTNVDAITQQKSEVERQLITLKGNISDNEETIKKSQTAKQEISKQLQDEQNNCNKLLRDIDRNKENIKILTNMQNAYEGFVNGVKAVLTAKGQIWHDGVCGSVAELIDVDARYATAIQVALGAGMQNIIVEDENIAKEAISYLKRQRLGRVTFLPLSVIRARFNKRDDLSACPGFINYADKLIKTKKKYAPIIKNLVGRIAIVDTLDNGLSLATSKNYNVRIVTLEGEVIHTGGAMTGGRFKHEIGYLSRSAEIKKFISQNENVVENLLRAKTKLAQITAKLAAIEENLQLCQEKAQEYLLNRTQKETQREHLQTEADKLIHTSKERNQYIQHLREDIVKLQKHCNTADALAKDETDDAALIIKSDKLKHQLSAVKKEYAQKQQDLLKSSTVAAALHQTIKGNKEKLQLIKAEHERAILSLKDNDKQQRQLQKNIDESIGELHELQESSGNLRQLYAEGKKEYDKIYTQLMDKRVQAKDDQNAQQVLAKELAGLQEEIHQVDLQITKISFNIETCTKKLQEEYSLSPQEALTHKLDLPEQTLAEEIRKMNRELAAMGTINPNAVTEYEALDKRHQFMQNQLTDLVKAKENLQQVIAQIDTTMIKRFQEAFTQIATYFNDIFINLFGGGSAKAFLTTPDDILSSGVEITVQAPGKKKQNLSLLSGGERTLTVIALLFAFLQYSPAPFSVLDEIDAPLDEANIKRFSRFLKQYAANTQFIIVTHRKGTMEAADVMYGITMEDAGISKIISVKMQEGAGI